MTDTETGSRINGKSTGKTGYACPPAEHQFKPGNDGRKKGSRNKLGEKFIADLYDDWQEHGVAAIQVVRAERPQDYLKVIAGILPKTLDVNVNRTDEMSDDELIARIRHLDATIRPFLDAQGEGGTDSGAGAEVRH